MKMDSLHDLYVHELKDLYNAENQIIKALPKMAKAATSSELRAAFEQHLDTTRRQVERLERIFQRMNVTAKGTKCKGMEGLIDEGEEIMDMDVEASVCDAALISSAQRIEHYEIAGYGTARTYARQLGYEEDARLLQETLKEEGETDKKLTSIAESRVNVEASKHV
jgi:ferritin-like metal-binding protein YciE